MRRRKITHDQFMVEARAQGVATGEDIAFVCPICRTVQSGRSLIQAEVAKDFDDVQRFLGFACIGRWLGSGSYSEGKSHPGFGCDWTLGGLFHLHELEIDMDGKVRMSFELATAEDAQRLASIGLRFQAAKLESEVES